MNEKVSDSTGERQTDRLGRKPKADGDEDEKQNGTRRKDEKRKEDKKNRKEIGKRRNPRVSLTPDRYKQV